MVEGSSGGRTAAHYRAPTTSAAGESSIAVGFSGGRPFVPAVFLALFSLALVPCWYVFGLSWDALLPSTPWLKRAMSLMLVQGAGGLAIYVRWLLRSLKTITASRKGVYLDGPRRETVVSLVASGTRLHVTTELGEISLWLIGRGRASARARTFARKANVFLLPDSSHSAARAEAPTSGGSPLSADFSLRASSPWAWLVAAAAAAMWQLVFATLILGPPRGRWLEWSIGLDIRLAMAGESPSPMSLAALATVGSVSSFLVIGALSGSLRRATYLDEGPGRLLIMAMETGSPTRRKARGGCLFLFLGAAALVALVLLFIGGPRSLIMLLDYPFFGQLPVVLVWYVFVFKLVRVVAGFRVVEVSGAGVRVRVDGQWQDARACELDEDRILVRCGPPVIWLSFPSCGCQAQALGDCTRLVEVLKAGIRRGAGPVTAQAHQ